MLLPGFRFSANGRQDTVLVVGPLPHIGWRCLGAIGSPVPLAIFESHALGGIEEGAQGSPSFPETLARHLPMSPTQEATMGFEPMIRVLQDPARATAGTLARLSPDSV